MAGKRSFSNSESQRELSPESAKLGAKPVLSKGSKRRPESRPFSQPECIAHIESLDPNIEHSPLEKLTRAWLQTDEEELPDDANVRLYAFMHEKEDAYDLNSMDADTQELVYLLVRDTELQDFEEYEYHLFEPRVLQKVRHLSRELVKWQFIKFDDDKLQKTNEFLEFWKNRQVYWRVENDSPEGRTEVETTFLEEEITKMPPPRMLFSPKALASGKLLEKETGSSTSSRKKPRSPNESDGRPLAKRQRSETLSHEVMETPSAAHRFSIQPSIETLNHNGNAVDEAVRFGQEYLSSPTPEPELLPPSTPHRQNIPFEPITPVSVALPSGTFTHESRNNNSAPHPIMQTPDSATSHRLHTPAAAPSRKREITFLFPRPTGHYNLDDAIPASEINDFFSCSLPDFFVLAAQKLGLTLELLDSVTLRYQFEGFEAETILVHKNESGGGWERIKRTVRRHFNISRMLDPDTEHFDILVGLRIGDPPANDSSNDRV